MLGRGRLSIKQLWRDFFFSQLFKRTFEERHGRHSCEPHNQFGDELCNRGLMLILDRYLSLNMEVVDYVSTLWFISTSLKLAVSLKIRHSGGAGGLCTVCSAGAGVQSCSVITRFAACVCDELDEPCFVRRWKQNCDVWNPSARAQTCTKFVPATQRL